MPRERVKIQCSSSGGEGASVRKMEDWTSSSCPFVYLWSLSHFDTQVSDTNFASKHLIPEVKVKLGLSPNSSHFYLCLVFCVFLLMKPWHFLNLAHTLLKMADNPFVSHVALWSLQLDVFAGVLKPHVKTDGWIWSWSAHWPYPW